MKHTLFFLLIVAFSGCSESEKPTEKNNSETENREVAENSIKETEITNKYSSELNGIWIPVQQEFSGKPLSSQKFSNQILELNDTLYTVTAESVDKGIVKYFGNQMDIYGKEGVNQGKHFKAIYKLENDMLTICYDLTGENYPGEFSTTSGKMGFMAVFKRK